MGVVWVPGSVGGSLHVPEVVVARLQDNLYAATALTIVAIDGTELYVVRNALCRGLFHVEGIEDALVLLQLVYHHLLDGSIVEVLVLDKLGVEEHLVVHHRLDQIACYGRIFCLQEFVELLLAGTVVPVARRNVLVDEILCVVHATMVGSEEEEVVALAHLLVQVREEVGERLVEAQVAILCLYGIGAHLMPYVVGAGAAYG